MAEVWALNVSAIYRKSSPMPDVSKLKIFYVFPVPVGPGLSTFLLFCNNNLSKYIFLVESAVGIMIS